jgi:hypothetical protein
VFSDFDQDGDTDVAINLGGHPSFDRESGERMSPEHPALLVRRSDPGPNNAVVTLEGTGSNRDAIGARLRVDGDGIRFYTVRSMQGFQSQNSRSVVVSLGAADSGTIEIRWPSGRIEAVDIRAGERLRVTEAR